MKIVRNYIIVFLLAFIVVISSFFMPEISAVFKENEKDSYVYTTKKTSFSVSEKVPYAMRFTETLAIAETYYGQTSISVEDVIQSSEEFFRSIKPWKYGCTLDFISAEPFLCDSANYGSCVVWKAYFYSETLKSMLMFAVNDSSNTVIGFYSYHDESETKHNQFISSSGYTYYISKYLPGISQYYNWVSTYSNMETVLNNVITYKVAFVDKEANSGSVLMYYNYRNGNIIFNMEENVFDQYDEDYEAVSEAEGR